MALVDKVSIVALVEGVRSRGWFDDASYPTPLLQTIMETKHSTPFIMILLIKVGADTSYKKINASK